jgi:hypothetical protein
LIHIKRFLISNQSLSNIAAVILIHHEEIMAMKDNIKSIIAVGVFVVLCLWMLSRYAAA